MTVFIHWFIMVLNYIQVALSNTRISKRIKCLSRTWPHSGVGRQDINETLETWFYFFHYLC